MAATVDYTTFGQNTRRIRRQKKLTQEELAEQAGICYQFLGRLERGCGVPSLQTVVSLCSALDITMNDLLQDAIIPDPNPPCRLRDDATVFERTLTDNLFPAQEDKFDLKEWQDTLPSFDVTLPEKEPKDPD